MILGVDALTLAAFVPLSLALNFTPGPDMMFCIAQGMRAGPGAAAAASLGISTGAMIHVTVAGLGLGALVAASPALLDLVRWIGAGYLLWVAWTTLRDPAGSPTPTRLVPGEAFRQGLIVNLTNPKVILFVLAFIPQFVSSRNGSVLAQFVIFGLAIAIGGFVVNAACGALAGSARHRLRGNPEIERWIRRCAATIFGAMALRLVISRPG